MHTKAYHRSVLFIKKAAQIEKVTSPSFIKTKKKKVYLTYNIIKIGKMGHNFLAG